MGPKTSEKNSPSRPSSDLSGWSTNPPLIRPYDTFISGGGTLGGGWLSSHDNMDTQNDGPWKLCRYDFFPFWCSCPPKAVGEGCYGEMTPCSCVDGLEKVTPFKNGNFWKLSIC